MAIAGIAHAIKPRTPRGGFSNQPFTDFNDPENARAMRRALDRVAAHLGSEYSLIIGGKRLKTAERIRSINPARPAQIVGVHQNAGAAQVDAAMTAALHAFDAWSRTTVEDRASLLLGAAETIRKRKFEFMAWLTYEVGKNWAEADADVGETIDFLEFYAREALRLAAAATPIQYPGERNELLYIPLGVGAVISPWNFPFAIMAGMTAAAIVTGNSVILKPSSDAPTIAARFVEVLEEAGIPDGVVNFCPGSGATFGNAIVEHPKTRFIAFTGSAPRNTIPARSGSSAPFSKWAARTRSSSPPMPTSTPPLKAWSRRPSASAARNARPARGPLWMRPSTMSLSSVSASAWPRSPWAILPPMPISARSSIRLRSPPCWATLKRVRRKAT
jgi:1-pyrroline-5-carboxylate dehydrogenase